MKRNTLFSFLTVAALGLLTAGPAYACDFTWKSDAGTDAFRTASNWTTAAPCPSHAYPQAGDTVTIQSSDNDPVISNDEIFLTLTINQSGVLTVTGANTLTLTGSSHTLDGDLVLQGSGSIVKFTASATVAGRGSIKGQNNGAEIRIATDKVLTNTTSIVGMLTIVGETGPGNAGKLDNRGLVHANDNGTLELGSNLLLDDTGSAVRWKASTNGGGILLFRNEHTGGSKLDGDFAVANCSKLKFDKTIETNGAFDTGAAVGLVDVDAANNVEFRYECDAQGGCTVIDSDQTYGGC